MRRLLRFVMVGVCTVSVGVTILAPTAASAERRFRVTFSPSQVCSLLTPAEVQAGLGGAVVQLASLLEPRDGDPYGCLYTIQSGPVDTTNIPLTGNLQTNVSAYTKAQLATQLQDFKTDVKKRTGGARQIKKLGDYAVLYPEKAVGGSTTDAELSVFSKKNVLQLTGSVSDTSVTPPQTKGATPAQLIALAKIALPRLK
jgi:hypothetical protein